jgi:hypothetical protein
MNQLGSANFKLFSNMRPRKPWGNHFLILTVLLAVSLSVHGQIEPSDPALLNTNGTLDTETDAEPDIATDGAGNWVATWQSEENLGGTAGTDWDIFVATSSDNGATWSAPALVNTNGNSDSGNDLFPVVASDGAGNWVAAWFSSENLGGTAGTDPDIFVATSSDNGATWSAPALVNTNGTSDSGGDINPVVASDGAGNWVAAWYSDENLGGTAGTDPDIFAASSTDNGATWSAPALLNTNGTSDSGDDYETDIASDGAGTWVAAWRSEENLGGAAGADPDIFAASSTDNGATWSAPVLLNTNGNSDSGDDFFPVVASEGAGTWVAAWFSTENLDGMAGTDRDCFVASSTDNGATWSAPALLNTNGASDSEVDDYVDIATDGAGNWVAAWRSGENLGGAAGTDLDIFAASSTDNGATWSAPALLNTNGTSDSGNDFMPVVATDGAGNWVAAWFSDENLGGTAGMDRDIFVTTFRFPYSVLSVPFYLDNASNFDANGVPADGTASFVGVKNGRDYPITLTITYTDTGGNDHTPVANTYVLSANSMVSWRPFADDPAEGAGSGQLVPNTSGGPAWGSVLLEANGPVTGRLITLDGIQDSMAMMLLPEGGGTTTLSVPFYLDTASNYVGGAVPADGTASFIGVKNMSDEPVMLTLTYTDTNGNDRTPATNTYMLPASSMVSWRPKANDPVEGNNSGQLVPNTDGGPAWGSVLIEANGPITGRLISIDGIKDTAALMLLPNK